MMKKLPIILMLLMLSACDNINDTDKYEINEVNTTIDALTKDDMQKINEGIKYCEPFINKMNTLLFPFLKEYEPDENKREVYLAFDHTMDNDRPTLQSFIETKTQLKQTTPNTIYTPVKITELIPQPQNTTWRNVLDWKYSINKNPDYNNNLLFVTTNIPYECVEYVQANAKLQKDVTNGYDSVIQEKNVSQSNGTTKTITVLFIAKEIDEY